MSAIPEINHQETTTVPLLDLKAQYTGLEDEIMDAVSEVCTSQQFILGPQVNELEKRIADYCHCAFGIGVSSGTDALLVALMALEIGPGCEVITSPYTFFATGGAIARVGATPLFCDIDPITYNIDPAVVQDLLQKIVTRGGDRIVNRKTGRTIKAIIPVHLFGQMADMGPLMEIARFYHLSVIEDAAQAIGAEYIGGKRAGEMSDIGCFSFFPSKNLGGFGDGGLCTTNNPLLAERLKSLRAHGAKPKYYHSMIGGNFRLDELQAAILLVKFQYLDRWTQQRQANAQFYDEAFIRASLQSNLSIPHTKPDYRHVYNQYVLRVQKRDELRKYLTEEKIGTEVYYPVPLHHQPCFSYLEYAPSDCPQSVKAAQETLAIPIYPELSDKQKQHVVNTVVNFYHERPSS